MLLLKKIETIEQILRDLEKLSNENKNLAFAEISKQITELKTALKDEIKSDLSDEMTQILTQNKNDLNEEIRKNTTSQNLARSLAENIKENLSLLNQILTIANFDKKLQDAINKSLQNQLSAHYRYQNATNALAICLQNQLSAIDEALKLVMSIELNAKKLELDEPYYKIFLEV